MKHRNSGLCRVCEETSRGLHFGVIACRACAAFFRRSVALELRYKCRNAGACNIHKSVRCMCRACRYQKCLDVGMQTDAVQLNRDLIGHHKSKKGKKSENVIVTAEPDSISDESFNAQNGGQFPSANLSANFTNLHPPASVQLTTNFPVTSKIFRRVMEIFESATAISCSTNQSMLRQLLRGYKHLLSARKILHEQIHFILRTDGMTNEENIERVTNNHRSLMSMWSNEAELCAHMVTAVEPFLRLPNDQQWLIFKHFWMHFMKLQRAYETLLRFGDDENDGRVIIMGNQTMNFDTYFYDVLNVGQLSREELLSLFGASHEFTKTAIYKPVKKLKPTEMEFIVLVSHMLWNTTGIQGISTETETLASALRLQTYTELHEFYINDLRIVNYAPRLAELMILTAAIEKSVMQKKEDIMIIDIFDLAKVDRTVADIFG